MLQQKMTKKFENADTKKIQIAGEKEDKMNMVFERSRKKEEVKEKLFYDKDVGLQVRREVHNLRYNNAQVNLQKEN